MTILTAENQRTGNQTSFCFIFCMKSMSTSLLIRTFICIAAFIAPATPRVYCDREGERSIISQ